MSNKPIFPCHPIAYLFRGSLLVMLLSAAPIAYGQEVASEASEPGAAETPEIAAFNGRFAEYREIIRQIEEMRAEYQQASPDDQLQINDQVKEKVAAAQVAIDSLIPLAIDAFRSRPEAGEIATFLIAIGGHAAIGRPIPKTMGNHSGGDAYELAQQVIEPLIEGDIQKLTKNKYVALWGLHAAIANNDFAFARKCQELIENSRVLTDKRTMESEEIREVAGLAMQYMQTLPRLEQRWQQEKDIRLAEAEADDLPRVSVETSKGTITIELFENEAPFAVANFISLVKQGFYDGVVFHRVLPQFMAQGGDPTGTGSGGPGYTIPCECYEPNFRRHFRGSLSMAHAGRDSGGSQFFLTFRPTTHLDGKHTVFGRVIEGWEVLGELQKVNPQERGAKPTVDRIIKATMLRDRGHAYDFPKS